jgi:hypothetical protein
MSTGDIVYVYGALLAVLVICSLPLLASRRGAGPRYRAAITRALVVGWVMAAGVIGWLTLGWFALETGGWFHTYWGFTLVLLGAYFPLLYVGIRVCNRMLATAQAMDRGLLEETNPAAPDADRDSFAGG